ncbi:lactonase family protein [Novosphingobium flavum]|uniref:Lactonase family protein n=1 Tax=Novosphingobium flavum TaxID=1778672 RepID=A0A7X1FRX4_9SPHN|nr:lactonase family protein [Novosphingobium flavum]MBC2665855.1 lactonase family protein [Novosphingobium flavum]
MRKSLPLTALAACAAVVCAAAPPSPRGSAPRETMVYIGTQGAGILSARLDDDSGKLSPPAAAAQVTRPTWLALDPARKLLFTVSEVGNYDGQNGEVLSYAVDPQSGALRPLSRAASGGGGPTHLSWASRAGAVFVANFGSGDVAALPVSADGRLAQPSSVQRETGSGPNPKQKSAHAHAATLDPSGRYVLVCDMGADKIFVYRYDRKSGALSPAPTPFLFTGPGTGPRNALFSNDGRFYYAITEHAADVRVLRWDARAGRLTPVQTAPLDPPGFTDHSASVIALSEDGRFLYAGNRTRSVLTVFAIDRATGKLAPVQEVSTGGLRPRGFALAPGGRWLLAGNQDSQTVAVFAVDRATGRLTQRGAPVPVGTEKPVSFAFLPLTPPKQPLR